MRKEVPDGINPPSLCFPDGGSWVEPVGVSGSCYYSYWLIAGLAGIGTIISPPIHMESHVQWLHVIETPYFSKLNTPANRHPWLTWVAGATTNVALPAHPASLPSTQLPSSGHGQNCGHADIIDLFGRLWLYLADYVSDKGLLAVV